MTPVPQRRPPPLLSEDEHSIDLPKLLKSEKGRSFTLPGGKSGSNRGVRKLENVINVRRSFNPLNMFRLSIARGQSTEDAITVVASAPVVKSATLTTSFDPKTPPMDSSVPVTKPRQSFWQRARQSFLPSAAANSRWQK
ncbi:unnamed protein product [Dibothriocephalus latus]|uniref:Uncharacterized protein n=1 Tax=Dibothriocephalus latus TaxID=60516 RepID=A0A3P6QCK3_DIBLA|nr:unnamed protein product [Dibothriocephalus latus]